MQPVLTPSGNPSNGHVGGKPVSGIDNPGMDQTDGEVVFTTNSSQMAPGSNGKFTCPLLSVVGSLFHDKENDKHHC